MGKVSTKSVSTKRQVGLKVVGCNGTTMACEVTPQLNIGTAMAANSYTCISGSGTGKFTIINSSTTASPADSDIWLENGLEHGLWNPINLGTHGTTQREMTALMSSDSEPLV